MSAKLHFFFISVIVKIKGRGWEDIPKRRSEHCRKGNGFPREEFSATRRDVIQPHLTVGHIIKIVKENKEKIYILFVPWREALQNSTTGLTVKTPVRILHSNSEYLGSIPGCHSRSQLPSNTGPEKQHLSHMWLDSFYLYGRLASHLCLVALAPAKPQQLWAFRFRQ